MGRKPNPAPGFLQAVQEQYRIALQNGQKGVSEFFTTVLPAMQMLWGGAKEGTTNAANTAKQAVKNAASKLPKTSIPTAGARPEFLQGVGDVLLDSGSTGRLPISKGLASAGLLTAILAGGMELADDNDPLARNIVEGAGVTGGQIGGGYLGGAAAAALAGGKLGLAAGPWAPIAIPAGMIIGGLAGGDILKNLGGASYDAVTGINAEDRAMGRQKEDLERRQELALYEMQLAMENQRAMDQFNADQFENQLLMRDKLDDRGRVQQLYDNSMANDQALITSILASL
tara:strand:- start:2786 stop:3643 length:858 start_codon:yes stop_codon:yes gene_type:complete